MRGWRAVLLMYLGVGVAFSSCLNWVACEKGVPNAVSAITGSPPDFVIFVAAGVAPCLLWPFYVVSIVISWNAELGEAVRGYWR